MYFELLLILLNETFYCYKVLVQNKKCFKDYFVIDYRQN